MGLVNPSNLDVANTSIITAVGRVFDRLADMQYSQFCEVMPVEGTSFDIIAVDGRPPVREWLGAKQYRNLRSYKINKTLRKWESTIELDRVLIDNDKTGEVGRRIAAWSSDLYRMYDRIVTDALKANSITGYDGSALLADADANVNGTTYDNLTTSALSFAQFRAENEALRDITDEAGEPLGMRGTHLMVGPELERLGMEITGSTRPVSVTAAGLQDAGSSDIAVTTLPNYLGGSHQLIVNDRLKESEWFVFDLSKPGLKPYLLGEFRKPMLISMAEMDSPARFELDVYRWSVECDVTPAPFCWQTAYGSVTD